MNKAALIRSLIKTTTIFGILGILIYSIINHNAYVASGLVFVIIATVGYFVELDN